MPVMVRRIVRRASAVALLLLLGGSIFAAHRHLNPVGDLLSDGPSDSGRFLRSLGAPHPGSGPGLSASVFVDDDPCLACFWHDSRTLAAFTLAFAVPVSVRSFTAEAASPAIPSAPLPRIVIRGPPTAR